MVLINESLGKYLHEDSAWHFSDYRGVDSGNFESDAEVELRYAAMPVSLERALLPFQREGVRFGLRRKGRALIADEMGVARPPPICSRYVMMQMVARSGAGHRCNYWSEIRKAPNLRAVRLNH